MVGVLKRTTKVEIAAWMTFMFCESNKDWFDAHRSMIPADADAADVERACKAFIQLGRMLEAESASRESGLGAEWEAGYAKMIREGLLAI